MATRPLFGANSLYSAQRRLNMQIVRLARLSLLTLVLLVTLILASSAFAAAPVATKLVTTATHHGFSYMGMGGGGCPFSGEYGSSAAADD
jgi:hypothetical protein